MKHIASIEAVSGLYVGDFRELSPKLIADNSVQLVFTQLPCDALLCSAAAPEAERILRRGGSMLAYSGQLFVRDAAAALDKYLRYFWFCGRWHSEGNQIVELGIESNYEPILWYVKQYRGDKQTLVDDTVIGDRQKAALHFIKHLTSESGTVVDFFAGDGTTLDAAKALGRKWIGFEVDKETARP